MQKPGQVIDIHMFPELMHGPTSCAGGEAACNPLTSTVKQSPAANTSFIIVFDIFTFSFPPLTIYISCLKGLSPRAVRWNLGRDCSGADAVRMLGQKPVHRRRRFLG